MTTSKTPAQTAADASEPTAQAFRQVRKAHAREAAEDYVEAIATIIYETGTCRVKHLAERFGVTHVTVTKAVSRLVDQELALTEPYRPITLTPRGWKMADAVRQRHDVVFKFLLLLGVSPETAQADSEGIEHHISPETLRRLENYVKEHGTEG